jgi:hypothetical protein
MKVIYTGPYPEGVEVPLPSGDSVYAEHGQAIDLPTEVAKGLLAQDEIWSELKSKSTKEAK